MSIEALVDAVWADDPPATARNQVKNAIWQLRRTLDSAGEPGRIEATPTGYSIRVASDELDRVRFERLAEQAVDADDATAAVLLREALAAWSEPVAFADLPDAPALRIASQGLAEQRLTAIERLMAAELSRGRHAEVVEELAGHAAANPTRERLAELHMRALYLCDRQADALAVYANTRRHLVDELGVEPGPGLRRMHETVLAGEPVAQSAPAIALPRPAQLPAAHGGFVGRAVELSRICGWISTTTDRPRIIAVTGAPGIGKTALAVEAAHRAAGHFPDGHLYVNLHGYDEQPPPLPIEVLAAFLPALGLPAEALPTTVDAASALYRSTLADRRMLVVLDNAANAESVRPLLPGTPGCAVVVTSRDRLAGLVAREGAQLIGLEPLPGAEATELLRQAAGPDRVDAEPDAAAELVRRCGQLPLALRIVAANLATNPLVRLSEHVRELEAAGLHGLAAGEDADTTVLHAFGTSYGVLDAGTQRLFRRVGLTPGRSFTVPAAAAAADVSPAEAERAVRRLATAHLVGACGMGGYTFHDLLRQYARQLAGSDDSAAEREQATALLFDWYRYAMNAAAALIAPRSLRLPAREPLRPWPLPFTDGSSAREWFDLEVPNLLAVIRQAAESGPRSVAWEIMAAVPAVCWRSPRIVEMLQVCGLARQAAVQSSQLDAAAVIRRSEG
ncbi:MAG TPA: BTAD domain-containing putative transcriptional regulator, partial [Kribbellaceae bacterium]